MIILNNEYGELYEKFKKILELHSKYLVCDINGKCANLMGVNLIGADLRDANLRGASLPNFKIVPDTGQFHVYKQLQDGIIAELLVPSSAGRMNSLIGRKCRVSKAKVIGLYHPNRTILPTEEISGIYNSKFKYQLGMWIRPDSFNDDIRIECTNGIHCFITRKEAEEYK